MRLSVVISTCDRPDALIGATMSILNQTRQPDELVVFNDGQYPFSPYFQMVCQGIDKQYFRVYLKEGEKAGVCRNYHRHLIETDCDLIFRMDDDCVFANVNILENMVKEFEQNSNSMVSCSIVNPYQKPPDHNVPYNMMAALNMNFQWSLQKEREDRHEHLYSSFMFNKNFCVDKGVSYPLCLGRSSFREETIFSHSYFMAGGKLITLPHTMLHYQSPNGGCRTTNSYQQDDVHFKNWLETKDKWNDKPIFMLTQGVGDCISALWAVDKLKVEGHDFYVLPFNKDIMSLTDTIHDVIPIDKYHKKLMGNIPLKANVYNYMAKNNWSKPMNEAYYEMFKGELK